MGKKQHQKDKLYLTCTEWSQFYGGKKDTPDRGEFKRLPFDCCALSFTPFEHPYCTSEGIVFDLMNIVPFLKKYGVNPVTGKKLAASDLTKLNFHRNNSEKFHCPVTYKIFNENTHIVAVRQTGNVYSYDAIDRLNFKMHNMRDLLTDEKFTRADLLTIQDPSNLDKFNIVNFFHIRNNMNLVDPAVEEAKKDPTYRLKSISAETRATLDQLKADYKPPDKASMTDKVEQVKSTTLGKFNSAHYSSGKVAASFTSTSVDPETQQSAAIIEDDVLRYELVKKKAYVSLETNVGTLNIELHSDMVPKTCENFLKLCNRGYYNNTIFHRLIKNFMVQGGDPSGTGSGGDSIWNKPFADEFKPNLTHAGRGVLSMANSGPDTNKSQFFITFRSCRHLDSKHTVFGRVVGGLDSLAKMEQITTDEKDRPNTDIRIIKAHIFVNPYDEADELLKKKAADEEKRLQQQREEAAQRKTGGKRQKTNELTAYRTGVGKYIKLTTDDGNT